MVKSRLGWCSFQYYIEFMRSSNRLHSVHINMYVYLESIVIYIQYVTCYITCLYGIYVFIVR